MNDSEILARLEKLEKENAELKTAQKSGFGFGQPFVTFNEFKGKQVIQINGAGKPLSFGRTKAKAIVQLFDEIKKFASEGGTDE